MIIKEIVFPEFPTHVKLTKTKNFKISTQGIYNAKLHHHSRSKVIQYMKDYVVSQLPTDWYVDERHLPIKTLLTFHAPINWGSVRMSAGVVKWKPSPEDYHPVHDLDNFAWIWSKVIQDCLVSENILPEDTVEFIDCIEYKYQPVDTFDERKISLKLIKNEKNKRHI